MPFSLSLLRQVDPVGSDTESEPSMRIRDDHILPIWYRPYFFIIFILPDMFAARFRLIFVSAGSIPPELGGLSALKHLYLFGNNLTGEFGRGHSRFIRTRGLRSVAYAHQPPPLQLSNPDVAPVYQARI